MLPHFNFNFLLVILNEFFKISWRKIYVRY
nr:MAG TPA: hypothetical protein [Caudoviricetes sp.]